MWFYYIHYPVSLPVPYSNTLPVRFPAVCASVNPRLPSLNPLTPPPPPPPLTPLSQVKRMSSLTHFKHTGHTRTLIPKHHYSLPSRAVSTTIPDCRGGTRSGTSGWRSLGCGNGTPRSWSPRRGPQGMESRGVPRASRRVRLRAQSAGRSGEKWPTSHPQPQSCRGKPERSLR